MRHYEANCSQLASKQSLRRIVNMQLFKWVTFMPADRKPFALSSVQYVAEIASMQTARSQCRNDVKSLIIAYFHAGGLSPPKTQAQLY